MRTILINQYHPPAAAPTGQVMADLAEVLVRRGHEVIVLCAAADYDDGSSGCAGQRSYRILRLPCAGGGRSRPLSRLAGYASFAAAVAAWLATRSRRGDTVIALTTPPFLGLAAQTAARGAHLVHWIMDLYPDVLLAAGAVAEGSLGHRMLAAPALHQWHGARLAIALGPVMERRLRRQLPSSVPSSWVPLWADGQEPGQQHQGDRLSLLYAGNLGRGHRCGEFLAAAAAMPDTRWIFSGGGVRRSQVAEFLRRNPTAPIELAGYVPRSRLAEHLGAADVHLASLDPAWQGCMVPSKLPAAFHAGRPVIFVGGEDNECAMWIRQSGGGWVVPCDDPGALRTAVDAARDPAERSRRGAAGLAWARTHFDRERNCQRIAELIETAVR